MGTHPANGLTWFSSYRRLISTFMRSGSSLYFSAPPSAARVLVFSVASTGSCEQMRQRQHHEVGGDGAAQGVRHACFTKAPACPARTPPGGRRWGSRYPPALRARPSTAPDAAPDTASSAREGGGARAIERGRRAYGVRELGDARGGGVAAASRAAQVRERVRGVRASAATGATEAPAARARSSTRGDAMPLSPPRVSDRDGAAPRRTPIARGSREGRDTS